MCGIYGITDHDPNFVNNYIQMCKHRGPDGEKVWCDPNHKLTLGHNLLSVMGEPKLSAQPWKTPKGNWLVYNGEIFNYYELKSKYKDKGFSGSTGCDTELLAWGLDEFGLKFLSEIDSMHGFAYYKIKDQELWLSRDHAGIKPLFYAEVKQGLIFGSEIKGMLDRVPGARKVDHLGASFMAKTGINALRNTFFSGVKKLLAGETLVYDLQNKMIKHTDRIHIRPQSSGKFHVEEFRQQVRDTVEMCSIGRRKLGVFLSGGLDSSMVAYELMQVKGEVNSFTNRMEPNIIIDEDFNSDANAASVLAKKMKFNHKEVVVTPELFAENWDESVYYMEQPVYNPSMAMYSYTNKFLSDNGIVVTLAGDMGDEILAGYPKYWKMRNGEWLRKHLQKDKIDNWNDVLKLWLHRIKRPLSMLIPRPIDDQILIEEFSKCYPDQLFNPADVVGSYMALDCVAQVPEEMFNRNDKYGMAYGMEGRFPLASKKFMKYCMSIHSDIKMGKDKSNTKILSKQAYQGILPDQIINKVKTGWTVPVGHWLTKKSSSTLDKFYQKRMGEDGLSTIKFSAKAGKALVPTWQIHDWIKEYMMEFK